LDCGCKQNATTETKQPFNLCASMSARLGILFSTFAALFIALPGWSQRPVEEDFFRVYDRARSAFDRKKHREAERLALQAAAVAWQSTPPATNKIILALDLAAESDRARVYTTNHLAHYAAAAALTDKHRDPLEWALVQHGYAVS
jgi:hypothetical protein